MWKERTGGGLSLLLRLCGSLARQLGITLGSVRLSDSIIESGLHGCKHALSFSESLGVVSLRLRDEVAHRLLVTEQAVLQHGHTLIEVQIDRLQLLAKLLNSSGLLHLLQEAVSVELIKIRALGLVLLIQLDKLFKNNDCIENKIGIGSGALLRTMWTHFQIFSVSF
jgi:hypothetical protein